MEGGGGRKKEKKRERKREEKIGNDTPLTYTLLPPFHCIVILLHCYRDSSFYFSTRMRPGFHRHVRFY